MRILAGLFCALLLLFTVVQYNDPDALSWGAIYGVGALFCGLAAFIPGIFARAIWRNVLIASWVLSVAGMIWYWPKTPGFWRQEVWWETETAREGMGMMFVVIALSIAWLTTRNRAVRD